MNATSAATARLLHVAALPFPTYQGTQALLLSLLQASVQAGRDAQLLTYHASGYALEPGFALHRAPPIGSRSLRSGPSAAKLVADAGLSFALRRACRDLSPDVVVAHHVEAASVAPKSRPLLFFAHTDLGAELPVYLPKVLGLPLGYLGRQLDEWLARRAGAIATVSPWLCERFQTRTSSETLVRYVPSPWPLPEVPSSAVRKRARERLGITSQMQAILYAGNLDNYQGWERLLYALQDMPGVVLIVGTESDASGLWSDAQRIGVAHRLRVSALNGETARAELHAAADVAAIVRRIPGGLPIKLLDALSRGLPCVVTPTARAGLSLGEAVVHAEDDSSAALARALRELLGIEPAQRIKLAAAARDYVAKEHSTARFLSVFDELVEALLTMRKT